MGGDTSGVSSRVKEEKLSSQGEIFQNIQINFIGVAHINQVIRRGTQVNMSANLAGLKSEVSASYVHW